MAQACTPPIQNYANPAQGDFLLGDWQWYAACNDWFWIGQKRAVNWGWIGNPWTGYQHVPKPTASPTGLPLGTPARPPAPTTSPKAGQPAGTSAPSQLHLSGAMARSPVAAGPAGAPAQGGYAPMISPPAAGSIPVDPYQPEEPPPEHQYPAAGWTPSDEEKETAPPVMTHQPPAAEEPPAEEQQRTPPAETGPCRKWHVFLGDTRFPVAGEPTKEAIAEATGVPLKNLAIVSVDDETCQAQASERVCSCDPGIWVDVGMSWQSTPATDLGKMVEEAKELRTARMAERHGGTTIVSFGDLYDVNNPKTYRGWHELAHKPEGEALPGVAMHRGGHKDFVYRQADANAARDWWLFRADPSGKPIWYGFASAFAVIMRFSPLACKAISNLNGGVPNNPSDARVRPGVPSIYAQWVKPWSIGAFGFDRTSSYDNLTVGAVDAGQIIREGAMQSQRRCLVLCDSPGLHTQSGTPYTVVVDRYVSAILQTRADDDGYTRRAHYENDQRIITQLNSDNTEFMIAYPRFYKGCYYTECIDPNDVSKTRRFGAACFWAFRPTLRISSIFTEFVPDENGDSWSYPASGGRIRGFYRKKPVVEGGSIPWSDPTRYRIRVDSAFWPAGTVFWDPSREAEPEDPPERWPNVFTWTVED